MKEQHTQPADIERTSMAIIEQELRARGISLPTETAPVIKRVIHTTADFEYVEALRFTENAVALGTAAMRQGVIVTDTNMACAGISKQALSRLGGEAHCFMAEPAVAEEARRQETTRAAVSMALALETWEHPVLAVGNAPTALLRIAELLEEGKRPALVIGVPVGFVNVVESKERLLEACQRHGVPAIVALGRKGGSNVAAAICNALLYSAAGQLDPAARGWN